MTRVAPVLLASLLTIWLFGCGPLRTPMVPRPDDEAQKNIDEAWEKALAPIDRLDHQAMLDVFVFTGAYQLGVDKLDFRSEKRYSGGIVVMEIHYDRAAPREDRFEVKVVDPAGKVLRKERYERTDVEKTYGELFVHVPRPLKEGENEPAELAQRRAKYEARVARIQEIFPKEKEQPKK